MAKSSFLNQCLMTVRVLMNAGLGQNKGFTDYMCFDILLHIAFL